ncbi:MAG: NAD-dependent epimerase/dehydratase family protein [Thermoanaerobaculia bacterium]
MRIFITGATGYIGGAVAAALRIRGHEVAALVRADADARRLRDLGVFLLTGDLEALPSLCQHFREYDAFVHAAQSAKDTAAADRAAVDTFTSLPGHFVYTSGVWVLGNTHRADEASDVNPLSIVRWRPPHEELVLGSGGAVLRPGCVYGGRQSLFGAWFAAAEQNEPIRITGDGNNRWALVDLHDLSDLYVRAVEQRATKVLHGIDDSRSTLNECAKALSSASSGSSTVEHVPLDVARATLGEFADALAIDQTIDSRETRAKLGWEPKRTFLDSIDEQWREWRDASSQ